MDAVTATRLGAVAASKVVNEVSSLTSLIVVRVRKKWRIS